MHTPNAIFTPGPACGRALVADDNRINRIVLARMLQLRGIDADQVEDGESAVLLARATAYSLILLDLRMPGMDGSEAVRRIRALELAQLRARAPIFVVTAHSEASSRAACLDAGADGFVEKPLSAAGLDALLARAHLGGSQAAA